jgi:hypothetical protein
VPYLGGTIGVGAALVVTGALNGFGNVLMITAFQRWAPPAVLGRLIGVLMLASFGVFPLSVALAALVVHNLGAALFFPLAGAALAVAILAGLTQRAWRDFGLTKPAGSAEPAGSAKPAGSAERAPGETELTAAGRPGGIGAAPAPRAETAPERWTNGRT